MSYNTRIILLLTANSVAILCMLKYLAASGIDIEQSTIFDNASNLFFLFDFLTYVVFAFGVNFFILSFPSKNFFVVKNAVKKIERIQSHSRSHTKKKIVKAKIA